MENDRNQDERDRASPGPGLRYVGNDIVSVDRHGIVGSPVARFSPSGAGESLAKQYADWLNDERSDAECRRDDKKYRYWVVMLAWE